MTTRKFRIFRWRAIGPLLLFLLLLLILWILFADTLARRQTSATLSQTLGTQVDLAALRIREAETAVDLSGLAIADPRDPNRNLLEAGSITLDLEPVPLTEKKIVIDRVRLSGLRFLTARKSPARPADPNSPAGRLLRETEQWARDKFTIPTLVLGRIDSAKSLVLHPEQLGTVKAAQAFAGQVDSTRQAFEQGLAGLQLKGLVDSSAALADRLAKSDPKQLGIQGVKDAVTSVRQAIDRVKRAKADLQGLEQSARGSFTALRQGLTDVDAARQRDYAMARGLLQLPSFDAPDIGTALFGKPSIDYFQKALYFAQVAQRYVPPGLQPWNRPGPKRTRMDGQTVEFPKMEEYPRFLLREGDIDLAVGAAAQHSFKATVANITSQPALIGQPATLSASGQIGGEHPVSVNLGVLSRHFGKAPKDSLSARVSGVTLPVIALPGLPFSVAPGRSTLGLSFSLAGDRLAGAWEISSDQVQWSADSSRFQPASLVESTVWRVISGLGQLRVRAELTGTISSPSLRIRTNLDDAIAARLKGLVGEELAKAEQKARAAVDSLVSDQVRSIEARVEAFQADALQRLPVERSQLDGVQQQLEAQLKRLAGAAAGGIRLPRL